MDLPHVQAILAAASDANCWNINSFVLWSLSRLGGDHNFPHTSQRIPPLEVSSKNAWPVGQVGGSPFEMLSMYCNANHHAGKRIGVEELMARLHVDENLKPHPHPGHNRLFRVHAYCLPGRLRFSITMKGIHTALGTYSLSGEVLAKRSSRRVSFASTGLAAGTYRPPFCSPHFQAWFAMYG